MMNRPLLVSVNNEYFPDLLDWKNIPYQQVGGLVRVEGFDNYNQLLDINKIFSKFPAGDIVDRTGSATGLLNFKILRPWRLPIAQLDLETVFKNRVGYYTNQNSQIDLFWSGGTDSTAMVVAFLNHCPHIDQLRLIYSPYSLYENRKFFEFVTEAFPNLTTVDISGDVYLKSNFDNIIVTGHGGDEFTASIDDSFFDRVGSTTFGDSWKDFFFKETSNTQLIEFCEDFFSKAGRPIESVLDARWWFYAATKSQVYAPRDMSFVLDQDNVSLEKFTGFFECQEFEDFMWYNIDKIIDVGGDYKTYKKFLRHYIYKFYPDQDYLENAAKVNSFQFQYYRNKKIELLDLRWICLLEDASVIRTKNLPLLSEKEFNAAYGDSLDYLFNTPN